MYIKDNVQLLSTEHIKTKHSQTHIQRRQEYTHSKHTEIQNHTGQVSIWSEPKKVCF